MNAIEYILLAVLAGLICLLAGNVKSVRARVDTLESVNVDDHKAIEDSRAILAKHAGDFVRIGHRLAALEGPRHLVGKWATHAGKDGTPRRVQITASHPTGDGNPPTVSVRLDQEGRASITYPIAVDQLTLES